MSDTFDSSKKYDLPELSPAQHNAMIAGRQELEALAALSRSDLGQAHFVADLAENKEPGYELVPAPQVAVQNDKGRFSDSQAGEVLKSVGGWVIAGWGASTAINGISRLAQAKNSAVDPVTGKVNKEALAKERKSAAFSTFSGVASVGIGVFMLSRTQAFKGMAGASSQPER